MTLPVILYFIFFRHTFLKSLLRGSGGGISETCPDMFTMPGIDKRSFNILCAKISIWALFLYGMYSLCSYRYELIFWLWSHHFQAICLHFSYHSGVRLIQKCTLDARIIHVCIPPILLLPYALLWNFPLRLLANVRYRV